MVLWIVHRDARVRSSLVRLAAAPADRDALPERCETCNMFRVSPDTPVTCPKCLRGNDYKKPHTKAVEGPGRAPSCKKV